MLACSRKKSTAKIKPIRNFDVYYDATLFLSSEKDYKREKAKAISASTTYEVRPLFDSMFSDTKPRLHLIPKTLDINNQDHTVGQYRPASSISKSIVLGSRRLCYYNPPILSKTSNTARSDVIKSLPKLDKTEKVEHGWTNKETQTDYRDSDSQTVPWAHDVIAVHGLQLLQLGWLKLDEHAKPGKDEIELIERFWQRKAWEKAISLSQMISESEQRALIEAMAANEISALESKMDAIINRRLKLSAKKLSADMRDRRYELSSRLDRFAQLLRSNQSENLAYLRHQLQRNLRKLKRKHKKVSGLRTQHPKFQPNYQTIPPDSGLKAMLSQFDNPIEGIEVLEQKALNSPKTRKPTIFDQIEKKTEFCRRNIAYLAKECPLQTNKGTKRIETTLLTTLKAESTETLYVEDVNEDAK